MDRQPAQPLDLGDGAEEFDGIAHAPPARGGRVGLNGLKALYRELGRGWSA
jgi:hypothetical protein